MVLVEMLNHLIVREKEDKQKKNLYFFAKYSGLFFEMLGIIGLGTFAGYKIDEKYSFETPIFTIVLSLFSVFISLYLVIKSLKK